MTSPKYQLWETYSVDLLEAVRTEQVFWERWSDVKIIDKIIAEKLGS